MLPLLLGRTSLVGDCFDMVVMLELRRLLMATTGFTKFKSSLVSCCYCSCSFLLGVLIVAEKGLERVEGGRKVFLRGDIYCSRTNVCWLLFTAFFVKVQEGFQGLEPRPAAEGGLLKSKVFTSADSMSGFQKLPLIDILFDIFLFLVLGEAYYYFLSIFCPYSYAANEPEGQSGLVSLIVEGGFMSQALSTISDFCSSSIVSVRHMLLEQ